MCIVQALKQTKDLFVVLRRNSDPVVLDAKPHKLSLARAKHSKLRFPVRRNKLKTVANEVGYDLFEGGRVSKDLTQWRYQPNLGTRVRNLFFHHSKNFRDRLFQTNQHRG